MAEFMNTITMSAIMVTLFFGGPDGPGFHFLRWLWPIVWFGGKTVVFLYAYVWIRAALPRLRYDQLMDLGWKVLIPLSLGWVLVLAAFLGGAYSSTVTTVAMSRRAAREHRPHLFAGGILIASGVMYLRLVALLTLFNRQLGAMLAPAFLVLAAVAIATGWFWSRRPDAQDSEIKREFEPGNPLELFAAFLFALFFLGMLVATQLAVTYLGRAGVNILAAIMGLTDVDPFIMGMTQAAGKLTPLQVAASAVLIAAASNNLIKGIYSYSLAGKKTGIQSLPLLLGLAAAGLVPLLWL